MTQASKMISQNTFSAEERGNAVTRLLAYCGQRCGVLEAAALPVIGILVIIPVWIVRYPPLVDYPNHLARYFILGHLQEYGLGLAQFYGSRWTATPYVSIDILAVLLQKVLPIDVVGRVILSLTLLALPFSVYFFLRQVGHYSPSLASWVLLIIYGPIFMLGLMNETLSAALCFFLVGAWMKSLKTPMHWSSWVSLSVLATLLYLTHLLGFVIAAIIIGAFCLWTRQSLGRFIMLGAIFLPAVLLYVRAWFQGRSYWLKEANPSYKYHLTLSTNLNLLLSPLRGYSHIVTITIVIALIISVLGAMWRNRDYCVNHAWLGVGGTLVAVYLLTPADFHLSSLRIVPFLFILGLCVVDLGPRTTVVGTVGVLAFIVHSIDVDRTFISRQAELDALHQSFEAIPYHSRVFPMVAMNEGELFRRADLHFWAYGVIDRYWFSPNLFHSVGIHPLVLKSPDDATAKLTWPKNPNIHTSPEITEPDWSEIQRHFDYVWVFDIPRFSDQLSMFGELVYSDGPIKVFRVFRRCAKCPMGGFPERSND